MPRPPPLLFTTDDRLARIESLLVAIGTTVDRIERLASPIDAQTRKQDGMKLVEILACRSAGAFSESLV